MLKIVKTFSFLLLISSFNIAFASSDKGEEQFKIAIVDMIKLEKDALVSKDLQKKAQKKEKELQDDLLKRKQKLEKDFKSLEAKKSVLSANELQNKAKQLEKDYQNLQIDERSYGQTYEMAGMLSMNAIRKDIGEVVEKVASKEKISIVIPSSSILFAQEGKFVDLTSKVVDKLNDKTSSVNYDKYFKEAKEQVKKIIDKQLGK